jgi:hypothetical protein
MPDPGKLDAEWKRYIKEEQKKELRPDAFVTTSLVSSIKVEEGFEGKLTGSQYGNVIVVPEFGKIFLAELRVDCDSFELTMIRLKMGCFASGTMTASSGKMNGSTVP